jgi:site-specific recombinase XerD
VVESHGSHGATAQARPCGDYSIAPRHAALKAFTDKFVYRELKLTTRDLLGDVERFEPKQEATKEALSEQELAAIRDSFDSPGFENVRDRAIFEVHMATALRFETVLRMPLAALDRIPGKVTVETKGGKLHHGKLDPKAMAHVRRYLRIRPETDCPDLFTSGEGAAT